MKGAFTHFTQTSNIAKRSGVVSLVISCLLKDFSNFDFDHRLPTAFQKLSPKDLDMMDADTVDIGMDLNELKELYRLNKLTMATLEEEIRIGKKKLKLFGSEAELSQELKVIQRSDGTTNIEEIKEQLHNDIITMEGRVNETAKLTGISIDVEERTELLDEVSKRSVNLSLQVLGREVVLTCEIEHVMSEYEQGTGGGVVSWLEVKIEKEINDVIGEALAKSTQDVAVHSVMCVIKSYLQCVADRDKLIIHFTQTYPDIFSHWVQSHTHRLKISSRDARHPTFILEWALKLLPTQRYINDVILKVEASQKLKSLDSKGVLDSASEMFAHLTKTVGLEKAIHSFVRMVVSDSHVTT